MKTVALAPLRSWLPSAAGREIMLATPGEPLFHADWLDVVFLHYSVDPRALQPLVPFPLDLHEGRAHVSLVAFTMQDLRPRIGGRLGALLFRPISTHPFLNVRTYVKCGDEKGIYFLAEWLPNPLSVLLGPTLFGLPYRQGALHYQNDPQHGEVRGVITDARSRAWLRYRAELDPAEPHQPCLAGTRDEYLTERYTAFTHFMGLRRYFRIWHPPWPLTAIDAEVTDHGLLAETGDWAQTATYIGAHHSPGAPAVWMGRPHPSKQKPS
jgi:uncharacterized protein YqjF (DUF2071 family)